MSIGQRIQQLRTQHHFTQQQLAQELHVTRQTISKWENDMSLPDMDMMLHICQYFEVELNDLLGIEKEKIDEVTLNDIYSQMTLYQDHLKKENKKKNYFNSLLIVLTVISLCLSLFMFNKIKKYDDMFNQYQKSNQNIAIHDQRLIHNLKNEDYFLNVSDKTYMRVLSCDLSQEILELEYQFALSSYQDQTTVFIEISNGHHEKQYELQKKDNNMFVFHQTIPLDNYEMTLIIHDGHGQKTNIALHDEKGHSCTDYLSYYVSHLVTLMLPMDKDGKSQLNQLVYEPQIIEGVKGKLKKGHLSILIKNDDDINEYHTISLDKKKTTTLYKTLPVNEKLLVEFIYEFKHGDNCGHQIWLTPVPAYLTLTDTNHELIIY